MVVIVARPRLGMQAKSTEGAGRHGKGLRDERDGGGLFRRERGLWRLRMPT